MDTSGSLQIQYMGRNKVKQKNCTSDAKKECAFNDNAVTKAKNETSDFRP